jgi:aryl-alcohol dehydrogenase-like predicted oxidoreductase
MIYRDFGKLGWKVSAVGMGTWNIGNQWGEVSDADAFATVRAAFDSGMNLFDTAEAYGVVNGLSEERLGVALSGIRHRVILVSKIGNWGTRSGQEVPKTTVDMIRLCGHASLHRLRTDWLDVVLCHKNELDNPTVYLDGFEALKKEGRIRAYGISTVNLDVLKKFNVRGTCDVVQVDYSLLNREPEKAFLPYCMEHGIAVMVRGPLSRGLLSGSYTLETKFADSIRKGWNKGGPQREQYEKLIAKVDKLKTALKPGDEMVKAAIGYVASHPVSPVVIPGAKSPAQAAANAAAGEALMPEQERARLADLAG